MSSLDALRQPRHTGSNRCWPCTVVNLTLVGLASLWLALRGRRLAGLAAATVGLAAIVLRGYVVPYTPRFAPQLVAAAPIPDDIFEKQPQTADRESLTATDLDGETVLGELAAAGVITADGELILPAESIDAAWRREMDRVATTPLDELANAVRTTLPGISAVEGFDDGDSEWLAVGTGHGELVARPVAVAELAAYRTLGDAVEDEQLRLAGARAFRMFLDSCPVCDSDLAASSAVSCCGGYSDPRSSPEDTLVCPTCRQRVYTFPTE